MKHIIEHFKDAAIIQCLDNPKRHFLYNEDYLIAMSDLANIINGKPGVTVYQCIEGGVLLKDPNRYAKIIKTKQECLNYMKTL